MLKILFQLGVSSLANMLEISADPYREHSLNLLVLLNKALTSCLLDLKSTIAYYILKSLRYLIPLAENVKNVSIMFNEFSI